MFEDKELVVQTRPTFRISVPGSTAIGQKHWYARSRNVTWITSHDEQRL